MQNFIKKAAITVATIVVASGCAVAAEDTIRIGTDASYPPFNYMGADGVHRGYEVDMVEALCERMDTKCEFVVIDWSGLIPSLQTGKIDAIIAAMSITQERLTQVDFTDAYLLSKPLVVALKDSDVGTVTQPEEDWKDLTAGVQSASTHAQYVEDVAKPADFKEYESQDDMKLDLISGRVDVIVDSAVSLSDWLKGEGKVCCKVVGELERDVKIHGPGAGIAVRKEDAALKTRFNVALDGIITDGTMKTINDTYFDFIVF